MVMYDLLKSWATTFLCRGKWMDLGNEDYNNYELRLMCVLVLV